MSGEVKGEAEAKAEAKELPSLFYNPDGGDLGRALRPISLEHFVIVVPYIARMMYFITKAGMRNTKHAFEFVDRKTKEVLFLMTELEQDLPEGVEWYSCDGHKLFDLRGPTGGIRCAHICYLVAR